MEGGDLCTALQEDDDGELAWYSKVRKGSLDSFWSDLGFERRGAATSFSASMPPGLELAWCCQASTS